MPLRLDRTDLWKSIQSAGGGWTILYLIVLSEDVSASSAEEREAVANSIEVRMMSAPSLEFYGRVGMYEFVGASSEGLDGLLSWCRQFTDVRCGLAVAGDDGLACTEKLMSGTAEAARQNQGKHAFYLAGDWVVPATSRESE